MPKSDALDDILSKHDHDDDLPPEGRPGRKPGSAANNKAPPRPAARNTQAWRAIEDMKENRRLDKNLKEVYEEGGEEE